MLWRMPIVISDDGNFSLIEEKSLKFTADLNKKVSEQLLANNSSYNYADFLSLIEEYKRIYFTGDEIIDKQILDTLLCLLKNDLIKNNQLKNVIKNILNRNNTKLNKLLYVLKNNAQLNMDLSRGLFLCNNSKERLKPVLLHAIDRYSMDDLQKIFYFENITFDILENLSLLDDKQRKKVLKIMDLLKSKLGTKIFPVMLSADNIEDVEKNIEENISILDGDPFHNISLFKDDNFNACFLANGRTSFIDLLTLSGDDFKLIAQSVGHDFNMLGFCFKGNEYYSKLINELKRREFTNDMIQDFLSKTKYFKNFEPILFLMDSGFSLENIFSWNNLEHLKFSYGECEYVYENITQDFYKLIQLNLYNYDTLLYIYDNVTNNVDEIIKDYGHLKNIKSDHIKNIHECIKKSGIDDNNSIFNKLLKDFNCMEYDRYYENIAVLFNYFPDSIINKYLSNDLLIFKFLDLVVKAHAENLRFFCENKILTSFDDLLRDEVRFLMYLNIKIFEFLYDRGLCKSIDDFSTAGIITFSKHFENVKYLYNSGLFTTFNDLIREENAPFFAVDSNHIKFLYDNNICKTVSDFNSVGNCREGNLEVKKFFYEKGICTTLNDFIELGKTKLVRVSLKNIKILYEKGICTTLNDFIFYEKIISYADDESLSILNELYENRDGNYKERINLLFIISDSSYSEKDKNGIIHKISRFSVDKAKIYVKICEILDNSNSYDIQVVKDSLIVDILNTSDPEDVVKKVKTIFMESDLPIISKIFQVFKYIYTEDKIGDCLKGNSSPYLQSIDSYNGKLETIYKDLMNLMIKSGELSLKDFILSIISAKKALDSFESGKSLDNEGRAQVLSLMKKIISLNAIINNHGGNNMEISGFNGDYDEETLKKHYTILKRSLLLKKDDSIYTFFLNLCKKIGYKSLEDILIDMDKTQLKANNTGLEKYNSMQKGKLFNYSDNYFLKGISSDSLGEILNRGVTSTEYLGGGEGTDDKVSSNGTPFDTDGVMVKGDNILEVAESHGYGDIGIVINTNKQCLYNTDIGLQGYNHRLYEIFKNHGEDCDYYGIRTGIASTEFDAIIYKAETMDLQNLQQIKYYIARNGFYLPVLDLQGNLLFTPQEYHKLRQCFSFSDKYKGYDIENKGGVYVSTNQNDIINEGNEEFKSFVNKHKNLESSHINIDNGTMANLVFDKIKDILESDLGIKCNIQKNLLGAELYDSGSTGRGTEIPSSDVDLDFTLLLNSDDYARLDEIQKIIHEKIGTSESMDHNTMDGEGLQIKSAKNTLGKNYGFSDGIRFDLLILNKTRSYLYPSNVAMQDRLSKINQLYGKDTLDFVRENIIIMKKLLKSQGVYKNTEGGMGGIGVENRIMQHHGSFIEALESFENIAYQGRYKDGKENISFDEFKNIYTIRDSGQNFKDGNNDNYVLKMNEAGYKGLLNIIKKYRIEGFDGIYQLIKEYEEKKADFIK